MPSEERSMRYHGRPDTSVFFALKDLAPALSRASYELEKAGDKDNSKRLEQLQQDVDVMMHEVDTQVRNALKSGAMPA